MNINFVNRDICPACKSNSLKNIYENAYCKPPIKNYLEKFYSGRIEFEYLMEATYSLYECNVCGLIFQKEIPNDRIMERLYEYWIDPHTTFANHQKQDGLHYYSYYAQEIMQMIAYFKKVPSSLSFFDFGMGWGKWIFMAKAFGCDAYGSELSEERRKYAASNGIKVIEWSDIPNHQFDFINTDQVFEHIANPLETLLHLKKALKYEGLIKLNVPTANDVERRLKIMDWDSQKGTKNSLNPVAPLEHINFFRRRSLVKMANVASMEEVFIPIRLQYQYMTHWSRVKNKLLPPYRNILKRDNCLFFRNK